MAGETTTGGASGAGRNARSDLIDSITKLLPSLFGSGTTTTSNSQTTGKNISAEQLNALISNMMASSNGLASVLMPQRSSGLYNSPVNTLLAQQLASQIAAKAAEVGTPTVTTNTQTQKTSAGTGSKVLGTGMALLQGGAMLKKGLETDTGQAVLDKIKGVLGLDPTAGAGAAANSTAVLAEVLDSGSNALTAGSEGANALFENFFSNTAPEAATQAATPITEALTSLAPIQSLDSLISDAAKGATSLVDKVDLSAGLDTLGEAGAQTLNVGGEAVADWVANAPGQEAVDYLGSLGSEGMGAGMDLADVGSSLGSSASPYISAGLHALDGEWGWGDTGAVLGSYFGPIGSMIGSAIGEPVGDLVEGIGGAVEDALGGLGDALSDVGDSCFLTTACMKHHSGDFSDDCRELTAMRKLRDEYAHTLPDGMELINEYYRFAPSYVFWLNARDDADTIWKDLYDNYVIKAVEAVEKDKMHHAYEIYVSMVEYVKEKVMEEV